MILDIPEGRFMVVSDIHGRAEDFERVMKVWQGHKAAGEADGLIFLGDLVHGRGKWADRSPAFIDQLIEMGCNQPGSMVYALLGNHELVHIYHSELWSGNYCHTDELEEAIAHDRDHYVSFFEGMPYAIRTGGGVLLTHVGGSGYLAGLSTGSYQPDFEALSQWDHRAVLQKLALKTGIRFDRTSIQKRFHPQLGENFRYFPEGDFLWELLMNKNERTYKKQYTNILRKTLSFLSEGHPVGLEAVVTGHVPVPKGLELVNEMQLRLSSAYGAKDDSKKQYLILDASQRYWDSLGLKGEARRLYKNVST